MKKSWNLWESFFFRIVKKYFMCLVQMKIFTFVNCKVKKIRFSKIHARVFHRVNFSSIFHFTRNCAHGLMIFSYYKWVIWSVICIWNWKQIWCILGSKNPKSEALFFKADQQVEQLSGITFTVLVKILLQCFMLPKCIVSYGVYFITDSGNESFQMPVPFW